MARYPKEEKKENRVGSDGEIFKNSEEKPIELVFKEYRTFEIHVGGKVIKFTGHTPVPVPRWVIQHPDFTPEIRKYFLVRGE